MSNYFQIIISIFIVAALVVVISQRFRISQRYERKASAQNPWSALDDGIDPTEDRAKE